MTFSKPEVVRDLQARFRAWETDMKPSAWTPKQTVQIFQCGRISFHTQ
jgi:hypothetical protein